MLEYLGFLAQNLAGASTAYNYDPLYIVWQTSMAVGLAVALHYGRENLQLNCLSARQILAPPISNLPPRLTMARP